MWTSSISVEILKALLTTKQMAFFRTPYNQEIETLIYLKELGYGLFPHEKAGLKDLDIYLSLFVLVLPRGTSFFLWQTFLD